MGIALRPSEATKGGAFEILGKVEVIDAFYEVMQYEPSKKTGDQAPPFTGLVLGLQPLDDNWEPDTSVEAGRNEYKVGPVGSFYPAGEEDDDYDSSREPELGDVGPFLCGLKQPNEQARAIRFMIELVKKGFREKEITGDARCLVGLKCELQQKKYEGSEAQFSYSMAVPVKIEELPYEAKGSSGLSEPRRSRRAEAKETTPSRRARSSRAGADEDTHTAGGDDDTTTTAASILKKVLARKRKAGEGDEDDPIIRKVLRKDVLGVAMGMKDLKPAEAKEVAGLIMDDEFMTEARGDLEFRLNDDGDVILE